MGNCNGIFKQNSDNFIKWNFKKSWLTSFYNMCLLEKDVDNNVSSDQDRHNKAGIHIFEHDREEILKWLKVMNM